jgi:hypothetical protein
MITINIETKYQDKIKDIEMQLVDLKDKLRQLNSLIIQLLDARRDASLRRNPLSEDYDEIDSKSS